MGRRGPPPTPTPLRVLRGNPSKRPLNEDEPKPQPIAPPRPRWLVGEAKREWDRVAPQLEEIHLLTAIDGPALACYCQAYADLVAARRVLRKQGMVMRVGEVVEDQVDDKGKIVGQKIVKPGYPQQRPEASIANKAMQQIRAFCQEFGMTPSARSRMQVGGKKGAEDPYEEFRRRGKAKD